MSLKIPINHLKKIGVFIAYLGKEIFKYLKTTVTMVRSFRIYNFVSFSSALLGFLGTFVIVMDNFGPINYVIDQCPKWQNISIALKDLDTFDTEVKDKTKLGMIENDKDGFSEILDIILQNRPDLINEKIVAVAKNQPMALGGIPFKIIHVVCAGNNQAISLTTEYILYEWVRDYREKYFLNIGIKLIALGFLMGILGHIKREPKP